MQERSWALAVRDQIAGLLATGAEQQEPEIDLSGVPTEALLAELRRRGVLGGDAE